MQNDLKLFLANESDNMRQKSLDRLCDTLWTEIPCRTCNHAGKCLTCVYLMNAMSNYNQSSVNQTKPKIFNSYDTAMLRAESLRFFLRVNAVVMQIHQVKKMHALHVDHAKIATRQFIYISPSENLRETGVCLKKLWKTWQTSLVYL